jgi:hypothetical protein
MQNSKVFISQSTIVMEEGERGLFLQASVAKREILTLYEGENYFTSS